MEWWEHVSAAYRGWWLRHLELAQRLARLVWMVHLAAFALFLLALLVVPRLWVALVPAMVMVVNLGTVTLLARTRTIAWRSIMVAYSVGAACAFLTAVLTAAVAGLAGLSVRDDGALVALAAFVEEPAKLLPLLVVAVLAPGRMRRLAAVDWALLGFALGRGSRWRRTVCVGCRSRGCWPRCWASRASPTPSTRGTRAATACSLLMP